MSRRPTAVRVVAVAFVVVLVSTVAVVTPLPSPLPALSSAGAIEVVAYTAPVEGPVVSPFDLPPRPWQRGNRGIDFAPPPGTPVRAAAAGEVVFAGAVGGALHVTLRHADGLRTSYSFLAQVAVRVGATVRAGEAVGVAGGPFHFGVRTPDGEYLDPSALLAGRLAPRPVLVPGTDEGADPLVERRSLLDVVTGTGLAAVTHVAGLAAGAVAASPWLDLPGVAEVLAAWDDLWAACTPGDAVVPPPAGRRIVVVVSGLGTGSDGNSAWELPTSDLGYADVDVVRFSYAGGRAPAPDGTPVGVGASGLAGLPTAPFTGVDSQQDLTISADRLAGLLADVARRAPGVPIDVVAHSQGGVVSRLALDQAASVGTLPASVQTLVTLGSPHGGAPLADGAGALLASQSGRALLDAAVERGVLAPLDPTAHPAVSQLGTDSPALVAVRDRPLPDGVRFTSIGARYDLTVPAGRARDEAAANVVVDSGGAADAHGALTTSPEALREIRLAVAGRPPTCQGVLDAVADLVAPFVVAGAEGAVAEAARLLPASEGVTGPLRR